MIRVERPVTPLVAEGVPTAEQLFLGLPVGPETFDIVELFYIDQLASGEYRVVAEGLTRAEVKLVRNFLADIVVEHGTRRVATGTWWYFQHELDQLRASRADSIRHAPPWVAMVQKASQ